jgi:hypothetical protein
MTVQRDYNCMSHSEVCECVDRFKGMGRSDVDKNSEWSWNVVYVLFKKQNDQAYPEQPKNELR